VIAKRESGGRTNEKDSRLLCRSQKVTREVKKKRLHSLSLSPARGFHFGLFTPGTWERNSEHSGGKNNPKKNRELLSCARH